MWQLVEKLTRDLHDIDLGLIRKDIKLCTSVKDLSKLSLVARSKFYISPQWNLLAGRLEMCIIHSLTPPKFSGAVALMKGVLQEEFYNFLMDNAETLNEMIVDERDNNFDIFAVSTLKKSYLMCLRSNGNSVLVERPQYMYMRIAAYLWYPNIERIQRTYEDLSLANISHASPTMFNAGTKRSQLASCFLLNIDDSMSSIAKSWHDSATISMNSGGIGIDFSRLRHSEIAQSGYSKGIIPWLKIENEVLSCVNQSGRRKGSGNCFLTDWHIDIEEFIEMRKPEGPEDVRARDLFHTVKVSDLFMNRVLKDEIWSLFCPNKAKGLTEKWGVEFESLYLSYEKKGVHSKQVKARELWKKIILTQIQTGGPYILYIDAANRKSNQKNIGILRISNLCMEIIEHTSEKELASCNLASVCLNACVSTNGDGKAFFDFHKLETLAAELVRNLNQVIERNYYPSEVPDIRYANFRNRPLGIGVQALADTFAILDIPWVMRNPQEHTDPLFDYIINPDAKNLNEEIFETLYYAAVRESVQIAKEVGEYETFRGSPASKGLFQFDLWEAEKLEKKFGKKSDGLVSVAFLKTHYSEERHSRYTPQQWEILRQDMVKYGIRNSLLIALMPTASSAYLLGNNESFEAINAAISTRTILSGQFTIVNQYIFDDLNSLGIWTTETVHNIIKNKGSIQNLPPLTNEEKNKRLDHLKLKYLTIYEIPQKVVMQMSLDRGKYVCQSQSLNCHMKDPTFKKMNAWHFEGWFGGAKTGMYYLRQEASSDPINMSLESVVVPKKLECNDEICTACTT